MKAEEIIIVKNVLKNFITKIRTYALFNQIYTYYVSDYSQMNAKDVIKIEFNYESLYIQLKRKILSQRNYYWEIKDSEIALVEKIVETKEFEIQFKEYIDKLFKEDTKELLKEVEETEKAIKDADEERLKKILSPKEDILLVPVKKIIQDNREFPYKSDKIKYLLMLKLTTDQIFAILQGYEKWISPRSYIEKYNVERQEAIKEKKIIEYPIEEEIKEIMNGH